MKEELERQTIDLDNLLKQIDEKKQLAERYEQLANTDQEKLAAFRQELEEVLRQEIISQSRKGKWLRRSVSFSIWTFTLIVGAALGAYFREIVSWTTSTIGM